jgi:glycosyltransferase involved in cell wall biosynthesis
MLVAAWEADPIGDCELILVGPGDTAALERLAPSQWGQTIRAVGESRDVRPWLWASDLLVLPSRYETVAVVVGEAMASGRAVVATDVNGAREVLLEGDLRPAGAVAATTDMKMLLLQSQRLLDDAERRSAMAAAALQRTRSLFSPDLIGDRLEGAYKEAIALAPVGRSA